MANVQKQFEQFNEAIKLRRYHENATLAEKRERILKTLSDGITRLREAGEKIPGYRHFNQGSYDTGVGVKPLDGDYDIDVGIAFDLARGEYDPVDVKTWVFKAVEGQTQSVEMRGPCVTVFYKAGYHVDLAIYADKEKNEGALYLARGKTGSGAESRTWTISDPEGLTDLLNDKFTGDDARQFRRVVRSLKRWKDERFPADGNGAPRGIAIAVATHHHFIRSTRSVDGKVQYDDLEAVRSVVAGMLRSFTPRLVVRCPAQPFDDLCARMSEFQMGEFKAKLEELRRALQEAADDADPHTACKALSRHFGSDFPVPEPEQTGKKQTRSITGSGNSG